MQHTYDQSKVTVFLDGQLRRHMSHMIWLAKSWRVVWPNPFGSNQILVGITQDRPLSYKWPSTSAQKAVYYLRDRPLWLKWPSTFGRAVYFRGVYSHFLFPTNHASLSGTDASLWLEKYLKNFLRLIWPCIDLFLSNHVWILGLLSS